MSCSVVREPSETRLRQCDPDTYPGRYLERRTSIGMRSTVRNIPIVEAP